QPLSPAQNPQPMQSIAPTCAIQQHKPPSRAHYPDAPPAALSMIMSAIRIAPVPQPHRIIHCPMTAPNNYNKQWQTTALPTISLTVAHTGQACVSMKHATCPPGS